MRDEAARIIGSCGLPAVVIVALTTMACGEEPVSDAWLTTRPDARTYGRIVAKERAEAAQSAIWQELDLRKGDAIVDIDAGGGFWLQGMADQVGEGGTVYGLEIKQNLVAEIERKFADTSQVKAWLGKADGTGLPENSCDVGFMVKVYHHIGKDVRID